VDHGGQIGRGSQSTVRPLEAGPRRLEPSGVVGGRIAVEFTTKRGFQRRLLAGQVGR
jgi:hypothetical protein